MRSDNISTPHTRNTPSRNTISRTRSYAFTLNNFTESDINRIVELGSTGAQYLFGKEVGSNGTPHLQGTIRFKHPVSFNSAKAKLGNSCHIESCKNWNASLNYCSKDGKTYTNIEKKKSRNERILQKRFSNVVWKEWQEYIIDIVQGEPDDRTIHWIVDPVGNSGKSFLCEYLDLIYDIVLVDGKKDNVFNQTLKWFDRHSEDEDLKIVCMDIPKCYDGNISYGTLEGLKNGFIYSGKYEGGKLHFFSPHVIVFSNYEPDEDKLSLDRWNIIRI